MERIEQDYFTHNMRKVKMQHRTLTIQPKLDFPVKPEVIADRGAHVSSLPRDGSTRKCHGDCTIKYGRLYGPKGNLIA